MRMCTIFTLSTICTRNGTLLPSMWKCTTWYLSPYNQWGSQNRVVAWAQVGQYIVLRNVRKVSVQKHTLLGGSGGMLPRKIVEFRSSETASAGFSGQVSVAKIIHISRSALVAIRSHAYSFAHATNSKLWQVNARAQAKVARARARVCQGLATPLPTIITMIEHRHMKPQSWCWQQKYLHLLLYHSWS